MKDKATGKRLLSFKNNDYCILKSLINTQTSAPGMKIVTYNLNGIRSALSKGFTDWVRANDFDIICLQETKAQEGQFDCAEFEEMGYHHYWFDAEKKGYSGVAVLTRIKPDQVIKGCGIPAYDREGRIIRLDFGDWTLLNCYFPSGSSGEDRQAFKMVFLDDFFAWIEGLKKERPKLIVVGDYNIAHTEKDIHDPVGNKKSSGFLPEERAWMTKWFSSGFTDAYRFLNPDKIEYSWWSFRFNARANNKGWRIDYLSVTDNLRDRLRSSDHKMSVVHSDHCAVFLELAD